MKEFQGCQHCLPPADDVSKQPYVDAVSNAAAAAVEKNCSLLQMMVGAGASF